MPWSALFWYKSVHFFAQIAHLLNKKKNHLLDKPCEDLFIRKETGSVRRDVRSQRKRASSEVFCCDHECYEPVEERTPSCKTKSGEKFVSGIQEDDKENVSKRTGHSFSLFPTLTYMTKKLMRTQTSLGEQRIICPTIGFPI